MEWNESVTSKMVRPVFGSSIDGTLPLGLMDS